MPPREPGRVLPVGILCLAAALLAGAWALDHWVLRLQVLTAFGRLRPVSPLYAFWMPVVRPQALLLPLVAAPLLVLAPRLCAAERTSRAVFLAVLVAAAVALPLALFLVREDAGRLGSSFQIYRNEEFFDDALLVRGLADSVGPAGAAAEFLRGYVAAMPRLSLHGQHFPPLHALWLYAVGLAFGPGVLAAGASVLAAFAAAMVLVHLASLHLLGEASARQATLVALAAPSMLDFACTSMDAVFLMWAALAWWLGLRAASPRAGAGRALLAGMGLAGAALASFSAIPLGLALLVFAIAKAAVDRAARKSLARQVPLLGAGFLLAMGAVWAATGFAWWDSLLQARQSARALMTGILGASPAERWLELGYGNLAAFALGSGMALVAGLLTRFQKGAARAWDPWTASVLLTLLAMTTGGMYSMETERVWLFAIPWLAAACSTPGPWSAGALRLLLAVGLGQALAMEVALFTVW